MTPYEERELLAAKIIKICQKYPSPLPLNMYLTKEELGMTELDDYVFNTKVLFAKQNVIDNGYIAKTVVPNRETEEYYNLTDKGKAFTSVCMERYKQIGARYPILKDMAVALIGAGLSLLVGYILWRLDNQSKLQEKQEIQRQLEEVNGILHSLKKPRFYQAP